MTSLPNILLIMTDEHQAAALSCRGHPLVQSPNLDRLANRGTAFTNAYTPSPICVPARAAFATGRYVHQIACWDNAIAYQGSPPGWGHALLHAGFKPVSIGKLHYRSPEDPTGLAEQIMPLHILDGIGQVWGSIRDPLPDIPRPGRMLKEIGAGYSDYNRYDYAVAEEAASHIRNAGNAKPWVLFTSFVAPHFPLIVPREYLDLYPVDAIELPPLRVESGYRPHPWQVRMSAFRNEDARIH